MKIEREFIKQKPKHISLSERFLEFTKLPLSEPVDPCDLEAFKMRQEKMLQGLKLLMARVLSKRQYEVMVIKLVFCLKRREMARQLGTTQNNVDRQISKAVNKLTKYMEQIRDPAELTESEIAEITERLKYRHGKAAKIKIAKGRLGTQHSVQTKAKISTSKLNKRKK